MESQFELKCTNGMLYVYEDKIVVSRNTFGGLIAQGIKGDKTFYYSDLTGVEYKKPTIWSNGYIKFIVPGSIESNQNVTIVGTTSEAMKDANSLILRAFNKEVPQKSEEIYEYILKKIKEYKLNNININNQSSSADEIIKYKHLLDEGIITQEEFETKKKQLLEK